MIHGSTHAVRLALLIVFLFSCTGKSDQQLQTELKSLDLNRGDITLCGSGENQFGTVAFSASCSEEVRADFNLAAALLHSFEYMEAEKVFARVMDKDPGCVMAYWGAAMSNFHPLWAPPSQAELKKGSSIIAVGRTALGGEGGRESDYLEAIATIYDDYSTLDHPTRLKKFELASQKIYEKYPEDKEAAIFYALALRSTANPSDKAFTNQKKAGEILNSLLVAEPNHPGITHYLIHTFDYPELADLALPAARKYASIAAASAHAQHMPSHIFTRLGLWDESVQSNLQSISAAQCYAQNIKATGHWDEELHGMDYLVYAYLQQGDDVKALEQLNYLNTITEVFPENFKVAYAFASIPARYAVERKDWAAAASLQPTQADLPWDKYPWEKANLCLTRLLGAVHMNKLADAKKELAQLQELQGRLSEAKRNYEANLVLIQVKIGKGWIRLKENQEAEGITLLYEAAAMEDATEKHSVTPGEIIPARELLADMLFEFGDYGRALEVYEADLQRHPNRFNGLYGAALALERMGNAMAAKPYYERLLSISASASGKRKDALVMKTKGMLASGH